MAAGTSPIFETVVKNAGAHIAPADTTTKKTVYTGGTNGSRIDALMVSSTDTAAVTLMWYITVGGTDYHIGDTVIAIGSGYTTVNRPDAIATLSPTLLFLVLGYGDVLKVAALATVTTAKQVDIVAQLGDY
jgi:citrate lyase beta subunit